MKLVFIGGRDIHILGGIENYMYNLSTQLVKMGHEPIVFCESDHNGEEVVNGFRVIHQRGFKSNLICKPWLGLKATWRVVICMRDVDFIHYNAWPPSLWSPIARLFGKKSLMQGHGLEWQRSKYSPVQQKVMKFMEWFTAHINRNLIMCSEDQCRYFENHYHRHVIAIPTAINLPAEKATEESDILQRFNIKQGKYFLFLARLVQDKNPNDLISAFQRLRPDGYQLVIAGNNPANPHFVSHLKSLASGNPDIIFTDAVYGKDKDWLLRNALCFCIPSTIEGLSISLLEAMSYHLPVIASDIPANREVQESDKAFWVAPENVDDLVDAYGKVINAGDTIKEMTAYNYSKVANNYTWEIVAQKYIATIRTIC